MLKKSRAIKNRIGPLKLKYLHETIRKYDSKRQFFKAENISPHAFDNDLANVINSKGERLSFDLLRDTQVPFAEENWGLNYDCTLYTLINAGKSDNKLLSTTSSNSALSNETNSISQPITANITMTIGVLSVVSNEYCSNQDTNNANSTIQSANKPSKISATPYQSGFFNPVQLCSDSTKSPQVAPSHSVSNAIPTHSLSTTEVMQNQQNTNSQNISDTYLETDFADDLFSYLENNKDCSDTDSPEDTLSQGSSEKAPFISIPHHNIFSQQFNYTSSSTAIFPVNSSKPGNSTTLNSSSPDAKRTFTQFNLNDQTEISTNNKKPRI